MENLSLRQYKRKFGRPTKEKADELGNQNLPKIIKNIEFSERNQNVSMSAEGGSLINSPFCKRISIITNKEFQKFNLKRKMLTIFGT